MTPVRKKIQILLMDGGERWVQVLQNGLKQLSDEYEIHLADSEAKAADLALHHQFRTVIMDPEDFRSSFLINGLRRRPGSVQFILIISPRREKEFIKSYVFAQDVIPILRPCTSETVHRQIAAWVWGKDYTQIQKVCLAFMIRWGFAKISLGWRYIQEAALEYYRDNRQTMTAIYQTVAERNQTSAKNVQAAISAAISRAWATGHMSGAFSSKPSNKQVIYTLQEEMSIRS